MAEIPAHEIRIPRPNEFGPDPEPVGTRFEPLLAPHPRTEKPPVSPRPVALLKH